METELVTMAAQFGTAGLIAWMWLTERRHGAQRDQQIAEAHARLEEQRVQLSALIDVVTSNTRAMTALEQSQRGMADALMRIVDRVGRSVDHEAGAQR